MNTSRRPIAVAKRRILILDDHPMTRHGLRELINCEPDVVVCGEAGTAQEALAALRPPLPDLVVVDLTLAGISGLEFMKELRLLFPKLPVLILSMHDERIFAERMLRAGASGYIMKTEGGARLLEAIRRVLAGRTYVSEGMSDIILDVFAQRRPAVPDSALAVLTDREFEVFQLFGQGLSTRQVGQRLRLSIPTIGAHRMHIKQKLKLKSGADVVQRAVRWVAAEEVM